MATLRIQKFSVGQTAKVFGVLYGAVSLVFVPILLIVSEVVPGQDFIGRGMALAIPIIYAVLGYVMTAIGCLIYNALARVTGGVELEMESAPVA